LIPASIRAQAELELRNRRKIVAPALTFRAFVDTVNPRYVWYKHCQVLADVLQRVADGELKRVMVFMPPRHGKSELVSRLFSAYYLYRHPEQFVGISSYAADLAYTFSRSARDNFQHGGGSLRDDTTAVKYWLTEQGGGMFANGVGGPLNGLGFSLGIIDDPIKNAEEAASETIRAKHEDWYGSTFYTRQAPSCAVVIVQTRWNEADLSGYVLSLETDEPEHWHVVSMPAIAEDEPPPFPPTCTLEPDDRLPGEALNPDRYPIERLNTIASKIGEYFFSALYQQRPTPKSGNFFKREWFKPAPIAPLYSERVRYWDVAGADEGKGDWTVGTLVAHDTQGRYYIEDVQRFQHTANERNKRIVAIAEQDRARLEPLANAPAIYIEQPPGLGKEATDTIIKALAGYIVYADPVHKDKQTRAEPFKAQAQAGNVFVVTADWNRAWFAELESFPNGKHDDQVDGAASGFLKLTQRVTVEEDDDPLGGYRG
jgi:predicted phage terminase large subunit-like protein